MGVPAGCTDYPKYVDMVINRFPGFGGNQVTFIRSM
jgi:hypothetical protein